MGSYELSKESFEEKQIKILKEQLKLTMEKQTALEWFIEQLTKHHLPKTNS